MPPRIPPHGHGTTAVETLRLDREPETAPLTAPRRFLHSVERSSKWLMRDDGPGKVLCPS